MYVHTVLQKTIKKVKFSKCSLDMTSLHETLRSGRPIPEDSSELNNLNLCS